MIGVQIIPHSAIENNIKSASELIKNEGVYPQYGWSSLHTLDNYTDAVIFDILWMADSEDPVYSGMINNCHRDKEGYDTNVTLLFHDVVNGHTDHYELVSYSRYWHGMSIIVRPLLIFLDYTGIKLLNFIFMGSLLLILCILMWKRLSPAYSICFLIVCVLMNLFILPLCMQYVSCFSIAMIGMICILLWPGLVNNPSHTAMFFFAIGSICNFFDLLTTPQLTYGLPFIIFYATQNRRDIFRSLFLTGLFWILGYGLTFAAKWTIGSLLTDYNCFTSALETVAKRASSADLTGGNYSFFYAVKTICGVLYMKGLSLVLFILYIITFIKRRQHFIENACRYYWLLVVATLVPIWYLLMRNHSFVHFGLFAWRALFLTFFSMFLFTYYTIYKTWTKQIMRNENDK